MGAVLFLLILPYAKRLHPIFTDRYRTIKWVGIFLFFLLYLIAFPKRNPGREDEFRNVFINKSGEITSQPVIPYLCNVVPEVEVLKGAITLAKLFPVFHIIGKGNYSGPLFEEFEESSAEPFSENVFLREYRDMRSRIGDIGGNVPFQFMKSMGLYKDKYQYYLRVPKSAGQIKVPLIVFMHGLLGNWQMYYTYLSNIENCAIVCIGTDDINGIFTKENIKRFIDLYLPSIKSQVNIDEKNIHLMGISNGGSGVNAALFYKPRFFKSYVYISTGVHAPISDPSRVFYIGGTNETQVINALLKLPSGARIKVFKGEGHFVILTRKAEVCDFIKEIVNRK
jgi:hypothetical protein